MTTSAVGPTVERPYSWTETIREDLEAVEEALLDASSPDDPELASTARYAIRSGGKRVRPAIVLLAYRACRGDDPSEVVDLAAALEMIHVATLIHDDILDRSPIRRRHESLLEKFGENKAIVTGDFFFVQGFDLGGQYGPEVVRVTADACRSIAEAEFAQARILGNPDVTKDDYLSIISGKTASLMSAGARVGGLVAGAEEATCEALDGYGHDLGMAFQIVDDILDIGGDPSDLGKPTRVDLAQGNPTIPTLEALDGASNDRRHKIARVLASDEPGDEVDEAAEIIADEGGLERARQLASRYADQAVASLEALPGSKARDALEALARFVVERES